MQITLKGIQSLIFWDWIVSYHRSSAFCLFKNEQLCKALGMTAVSNNCSSKALHVQFFMTCRSTKYCLITIQQIKYHRHRKKRAIQNKTPTTIQNAHNNTNTFTNYCVRVTLISIACAWCLNKPSPYYKYGYFDSFGLPSCDRYVMCDCLLTKGRVTVRLIR